MKRCLLWLLVIALVLPLVAEERASNIDPQTCARVKQELLQKYGEALKFRIERGVDQVAELWRTEDGDKDVFAGYCRDYFVADDKALAAAFAKMEFYSEVINGGFGEMSLDKDQPVDLDWGEITPLDIALNQFNLAAHVSDDLYQNKIAFFSLLNFPAYTLAEKIKLGPNWDRRQWAYVRSGGSNATRIPSEVSQKISALFANAQRYISEYNIFMGCLVDEKGQTHFPADMKLISHWGIRDELKARYADKESLFKQRMIYRVMERIIRQEIPAKVINSDKCQWDPFRNQVFDQGRVISAEREMDARYQTFLDVFQAMHLADPFSPRYPNHIVRSFELNREIPEKDVEAWFVELLSSAQVRRVGRLVAKKLGRKLQPFDIWYNGFRAGAGLAEEKLDKIVAQKYPNNAAFEKDIPNILVKLGFTPESAAYIAPRIQVDAARGSGHCAGPGSRKYKVRLRTRVPASGMNYKGYNVAIHELGHAVESVLDLHKIDYYSLSGVPNNAFTEAFAFVFQDRDLDILGVSQPDPLAWERKVLDTFWNSYEGMGVSLVDMKAWHWLYDHPQATPAQLREAVVAIAREIWNKYYASVFGVRDQVILAVYSHMIDYALYLPHYAIGNLIQFQIEEYLRGKAVGPEMERMCAAGNIIPDLWMRNAVGSAISVKPILRAVDQALTKMK